MERGGDEESVVRRSAVRRLEMRNVVMRRVEMGDREMGGEMRCFVERGGEDRDGDEER